MPTGNYWETKYLPEKLKSEAECSLQFSSDTSLHNFNIKSNDVWTSFPPSYALLSNEHSKQTLRIRIGFISLAGNWSLPPTILELFNNFVFVGYFPSSSDI